MTIYSLSIMTLERDDDALYMRNMEIRGYVMLQALLSAKTIYEAGPWLHKNQAFAKKFLADGHHKFKMALHLESKIQKQLASIKEQESVDHSISRSIANWLWLIGRRLASRGIDPFG